jgi:cytochrome c553
MKRTVFSSAIILGVAAFFISCGKSFDLGSAPRTDVVVDLNNLDWEDHIQFIMQVKCMNCHVSPRPPLAPSNATELALDKFTVFQAKKNIIKLRVLSEDDKVRMPPLYATQLSDDEKEALKKYIDALPAAASPPVASGGTTDGGIPTALTSNFNDQSCSGCHGPGGSGGSNKVLKGTALTEAEFIDTVRYGKRGMPFSVKSSDYSDADLSADYKFLKSQTP